MIDLERRKALKAGGGLGLLGLLAAVGLLRPGMAAAEVAKAAFDAKTLDEALSALGVTAPASSESVRLTVPEIAEDGRVVPVAVDSSLAKTEQIFILVEDNPNALAAEFAFPEGTEGYISTRIKMRKTSMVVALVKADGKFYRVAKQVKVTAGGCGG